MSLAIGDYLKNRVSYHADLYQQKICDNVKMTAFDKNIFDILFFVIEEYLNQGHTVVTLSSNWQKTIIDILMTHINDELGFVFDVGQIFDKMDEFANEPTHLKYISDETLNLLKTQHQKHQMSAISKQRRNDIENQHFMAQLSQKLLWVLRFYYHTTHKMNDSLSALVAVLSAHCFFGQSYQADRPIMWVYHQDKCELYLWLNRIYHTEKKLLAGLNAVYHANIEKITPTALSSNLNQEQQQAICAIFNHSISIITGGPGTGKTFTIAQAVSALLQHPSQEPITLALVAPTGKAAQRMKESLVALMGDKVQLPDPMTIHRLLGIDKNGLPRHTPDNPLPFDLVIVDEASMIGVELAQRLMAAIKIGARLVLLGDTHQLFAVEAGSVLSDLCDLPMMAQSHVRLVQSRRFKEDSGVGKLAKLVNDTAQNSAQAVFDVVDRHADLTFCNIGELSQRDVERLYESIILPYQGDEGYFELTKRLKRSFYKASDEQKQQHIKQLNDKLGEYRILCASHLLDCGDHAINGFIKQQHQAHLNIPQNTAKRIEWYHGRPVMMLKNRYDLGLFNGDIGICMQTGRQVNDLTVFFYGETMKYFPISMLSGDVVSTAYAMTIHKSQGSEFDTVAVVCHQMNGQLLSKELLYTAITRAKKQVRLYSTPVALERAINQPTIRHTGLGLHDTSTDKKWRVG